VPGGAQVEAGAPTVVPTKEIALILKQPDFTTAKRLAEAIIAARGPNSARVNDAATVVVPLLAGVDATAVIAQLEPLEVDPDVKAKVIVDEKTGTIVIGEAVALRSAAITFGSLTVEITEDKEVSQPQAPLAPGGKAVVVPKTKIDVKEEQRPMRVVNKAATVGDVAAALAALGAKPRDLVSILRALHAAGALRADLESM